MTDERKREIEATMSQFPPIRDGILAAWTECWYNQEHSRRDEARIFYPRKHRIEKWNG